MGKMVRKQIYVEPEQDVFLKRRSRELGITEAELIRRGIDRIARIRVAPPRDEQAWQEALAFMEERARLVVPQNTGGRGWTREDLYDERLGRRSVSR